MFGEDLFLVIKLIAYLLIVTFQGRSGEGALWGTFYKGNNPFMREPILEPNNLPKPSPKTIKLKVKISMYEFWEDISFQSNYKEVRNKLLFTDLYFLPDWVLYL